MKSIFKRTLATATGSVLALSQLLSVANVNISAADTKTLKIDAASILSVPFEETNPLAANQSSDWADKVESKFIELGSHSYSYSSQKIKNEAAKILKKDGFSKYLSSEDADALVAQFAPQVIGKTEADGTFSAELSINEIGDIVGSITQNLYTNSGAALKDDDGNPINVDWSGFKMSGKIIVSGKFDFENKKVAYETTIIDENGKEYKNDAGIEQYAKDKLAQAKQIALSAADGKSATKYTKRVNELADAMETKIGYIRQIADAVAQIALQDETSAETAYADYSAALGAKIATSGVPAAVAARVGNAINKRKPESVSSAISSERFNTWYTKAVDTLNKNNQGVEIAITVDEIKSLLNEGYDYDIDIPNGYSADVFFKYKDDENAQILDAVKKVYTADGFITGADLKTLADQAADAKYQDYKVIDATTGTEVTDFDKNYTVTAVVSHKEITAKADTTYAVQGELSYDAERVIEQIIVEAAKETTTSTTTSTTTTSTTTTTIDTTTDTTTTTLATYVSFEVGAQGQNELIYWSEETDATFDFSEIQITAHFVVAGEDQKEQTVDVSSYFSAAANSPAELGVKPEDVKGVLRKPVDLILKDEAGLRTALATVPGYDVDAIMNDQGFAQGKAISYFNVILVLRGDANLDGEVDAVDAQNALNYYVDSLALKSAKSSITAGRYLNEYENGMSVLRYSHYAADISGDGVIDSFDAQKTLVKYVRWLSLIDKTWDEITGTHFVPKNVLHADPLAYDEPAKKDYQEFIDAQ